MWQHRNSPLKEAEPRAIGHVAVPEPMSIGKRGLKLRNTRQRQSSPQQEGKVWDRGIRGSIGAHLVMEARCGDVEHVAAPEPTSKSR
jgi:hypothetical protein